MIKRIMSITIVVALVLVQSNAAMAFVRDGIYGLDPGDPAYLGPALVASVDLSGGTPVADLEVFLRDIGNPISTPSTIGWSGIAQGTTEWKVSDQYVEVRYDANQIGWGVQIYTDNMNAAADPQYPGDPTTDPNQQPAGLIGVDNTLLTCPMAILVTNDPIDATDIQDPVEETAGTPGQPDYVVYFTSGYDEDPTTTGVEKVWFWLKDKSGTKWDDTIGSTPGSIDPGELVSNFSATGDDYATIVNTYGSSSGWVHALTGNMQRDSDADSPLNVYVTADFTNAKELQEYKTNTITLEIYHE